MAKIIVIGLGPLGQKTVRYAARRENIEIVGAVDIDPDKIGKDVGTLCRIRKLGIPVSGDLKSALRGKKADAAVLTTVSSLKKLAAQVAEAAGHKLDIVSTCEELAFPFKTAPSVARRIDAVCKKHKVTCLGTGVNPGFLMDYLPAVMTAVNQGVKKITVQRIQDASVRRIPFQQKIGAGLTRAQFKKKQAEGTLRHVGLPESIGMIAHAMGWDLTRTTEALKPVIAAKRITSGYTTIEKGMACGVEQIGRGYIGAREVIKLHFRAAVGEPRSFDRIEVKGEPNVVSEIDGGVNGDIATCAIVLNAMRSAMAAAPGLRTMLDIPAATFNS